MSKHLLLDSNVFDPVKLENDYVHQVYESIAPEFSSTRHSQWPSVVQFIESQPISAIGADIGCGNGKYLVGSSQSFMIGMERSANLAQIVQERGFDVALGDVLNIPLVSSRLDYFICIAVIHHLSTAERRCRAVNELARILRIGGRGLIQVWAKEQSGPTGVEPSKYIDKNKSKRPMADSNPMIEVAPGTHLPLHVPKTEFPVQDMLVPWQKKVKAKDDQQSLLESTLYGRYYHLFVKRELEDLIEQVPCLSVEKSYYDQGNWAVCIIRSS